MIIAPIMQHFNSLGVPKLDQCIIIPFGDMRLVPYHALLDSHSGNVFGEKCQLTIIPSTSLLQERNRNKACNNVILVPGEEEDFLIVGNPKIPSFKPLSYATREAKFIANGLGTVPVLREQATKEIVLHRMKSAKIIHLAIHGPDCLAFSCIMPSGKYITDQRWKLYPNEIKTLSIPALLVVLSSCGSKESQKDMVDAFISAGARCVVSSLWKVGDESVYIFMQFFYQLFISGLPSLQAFQRAIQFVRCLPEYNYFIEWGGLQHIGESIELHKNINAHFPIHELLGQASIFSRSIVDDVEDCVLAASCIQVCMYVY